MEAIGSIFLGIFIYYASDIRDQLRRIANALESKK